MSDQKQLPTLTDGVVVLRAPKPGDVEGRFALGNTPEIHHMFGADPGTVRPLTREAAEAWVEAQAGAPYGWIIEVDGQLIGSGRLHSIDHLDQRASVALGILDKEALGKGFGTRALHLLVEYAFDALNLHRVDLRVLDYNARAIHAYKKVGFVVEGRQREAARIGGNWHDDLMMGLLVHEYRRRAA
ncbi:MAG: GNAT family N-acetyltransferase [Rhodobacteraceae bacterium]|nr:GNAT family N-acetyltransferase [Paracoccaceae bacterium]